MHREFQAQGRDARATSPLPSPFAHLQAISEAADKVGRFADAFAAVGSGYGSEPESRTREEYELQVDTYLAELRDALPAFLKAKAAVELPTCRFTIKNQSTRNYRQDQVILHFPRGYAMAVHRGSPDLTDTLPTEPREWGAATGGFPAAYRAWTTADQAQLRQFAFLDHVHGPQVRIRIREHHSATYLDLPAVDLRPRQALTRSDDVVLLVPTSTSTLPAHWEATTTNIDRIATGEFTVPVEGEDLDLSRWL